MQCWPYIIVGVSSDLSWFRALGDAMAVNLAVNVSITRRAKNGVA